MLSVPYSLAPPFPHTKGLPVAVSSRAHTPAANVSASSIQVPPQVMLSPMNRILPSAGEFQSLTERSPLLSIVTLAPPCRTRDWFGSGAYRYVRLAWNRIGSP